MLPLIKREDRTGLDLLPLHPGSGQAIFKRLPVRFIHCEEMMDGAVTASDGERVLHRGGDELLGPQNGGRYRQTTGQPRGDGGGKAAPCTVGVLCLNPSHAENLEVMSIEQ